MIGLRARVSFSLSPTRRPSDSHPSPPFPAASMSKNLSYEELTDKCVPYLGSRGVRGLEARGRGRSFVV